MTANLLLLCYSDDLSFSISSAVSLTTHENRSTPNITVISNLFQSKNKKKENFQSNLSVFEEKQGNPSFRNCRKAIFPQQSECYLQKVSFYDESLKQLDAWKISREENLEMEVSAEIKTGHRRIIECLVYPLIKALDETSQEP